MSEAASKPRSTRVKGRDPALPSLLGDALCLDFVNTVNDRTGRHKTDYLTEYADLVRWSWHARLIESDQRDRLLVWAEESFAQSDAIFAQAIDLREAIYRIFVAVIAADSPSEADISILQRIYLAALAKAQLVRDDSVFTWEWNALNTGDDLQMMLWPIAQSAVEILTSSQIDRVKQCPGCDDCGWLFLDISKNGTRRWCSMEDCGSRAKMRRLYARRKAE